MSRHDPTRNSWREMMRRCYSRSHPRYKDWGGRGIRVCRSWHRFENFLADMGERPVGMTLERDNNDWGYGVDNCRWASRKDQAFNRRSTIVVQGMCLKDFAKSIGLNYSTAIKRYHRGSLT